MKLTVGALCPEIYARSKFFPSWVQHQLQCGRKWGSWNCKCAEEKCARRCARYTSCILLARYTRHHQICHTFNDTWLKCCPHSTCIMKNKINKDTFCKKSVTCAFDFSFIKSFQSNVKHHIKIQTTFSKIYRLSIYTPF